MLTQRGNDVELHIYLTLLEAWASSFKNQLRYDYFPDAPLFLRTRGPAYLVWLCGGRIKHVNIKMNYLQELKESGYLHVVHKKNEGGNIIPDVGTKNLPIVEY